MLSSGALIAGACSRSPCRQPLKRLQPYFDDFNDQQNVNAGGPYTQTLYTTAHHAQCIRREPSATWQAGVETGGWGQRDSPTATLRLPPAAISFPSRRMPDRIYKVQPTIDTTPLGGADPVAPVLVHPRFHQLPTQLERSRCRNHRYRPSGPLQFQRGPTITYTRERGGSAGCRHQYVGWVTDAPG